MLNDRQNPVLSEPDIEQILYVNHELNDNKRDSRLLRLFEKYDIVDIMAAQKIINNFPKKEFVPAIDPSRNLDIAHVDYYTGAYLYFGSIKRNGIIRNNDGSIVLIGKDYSLIVKNGEIINTIYNKTLAEYRKLEIANAIGLIMALDTADELTRHTIGPNDLFLRRNDAELPLEFLGFAKELKNSGWERPGDTEKDIFDNLVAKTNYFAYVEKENNTQDADYSKKVKRCGCQSPIAKSIYIRVDKWSSELEKHSVSNHEKTHTYNAVYGKEVVCSGLHPRLLFKEELEYLLTYDPNHNNLLTLSAEQEQELKLFIDWLSADEKLERGINQLDEGFTEFIQLKTIFGNGNICEIESINKSECLMPLYFTSCYICNLLQNAFGEERLRAMFYSGPVNFMKEYDKLVGAGKFFELLQKMSQTYTADIMSTIGVLEYVLDNIPNAGGNSTKESIIATANKAAMDYDDSSFKTNSVAIL